MFVKSLLVMTGAEAEEACGTEQLCGGLEEVIERVIHAVWLLWKQNPQE